MTDETSSTTAADVPPDRLAIDPRSPYFDADKLKRGVGAARAAKAPRAFALADMVEKPSIEEAPSNMAVLGRYVITPEVFGILEETPPGRGNEIQLTDALRTLAKIQPMYAYNFEGRRYDVGDKQGFLEATVEYALRRPELRDRFLAYLKKVVAEEN